MASSSAQYSKRMSVALLDLRLHSHRVDISLQLPIQKLMSPNKCEEDKASFAISQKGKTVILPITRKPTHATSRRFYDQFHVKRIGVAEMSNSLYLHKALIFRRAQEAPETISDLSSRDETKKTKGQAVGMRVKVISWARAYIIGAFQPISNSHLMNLCMV